MELLGLWTDAVAETQWKEIYESLSEARRGKADRIRIEEKRRQSMAAGLLLECLLKEHGVPEPFCYGISGAGKPFLPGTTNIHFSLSHTKGMAVCALSDRPVGVDVERIRPIRENIARRYFDAEEQALLAGADREERFFEIWTRKEAEAKFLGVPLMQLLERGSRDEVMCKSWREGTHVVTLCDDRGMFPGSVRFLPAEELLAPGTTEE